MNGNVVVQSLYHFQFMVICFTANDYTYISVTVTIPANSIGTCTAITIVDDIFVEGGTSNFTARITGSTYIAVPANRSTTVITIIDIDGKWKEFHTAWVLECRIINMFYLRCQKPIHAHVAVNFNCDSVLQYFHSKYLLHLISVVTFGFWANNPLTVLESSTTVQICAQIMNNVVLGIPVTVELRVTGVTAKSKNLMQPLHFQT